MYEQGNLNFAHARNTDPPQSYMAADSMTVEKLTKGRREVLWAVNRWPGCTAKQIDKYWSDGKAHRRAKELEDLGLITRDPRGREMKLFITEKGKEMLK